MKIFTIIEFYDILLLGENMDIIVNKNKIELKYANNFFKKLLGLSFKKNINYCLCFKCNGIHTFFMKEKIDVILTDKDNNILYTFYNLNKNKIILPKKNVYYTYEFPNNFLNNQEIKKIEIK